MRSRPTGCQAPAHGDGGDAPRRQRRRRSSWSSRSSFIVSPSRSRSVRVRLRRIRRCALVPITDQNGDGGFPDRAADQADAGQAVADDPRRRRAGCSSRSGTGSAASSTRDGDDLELTSRSERPFTRYFPELLPVLAAALPDHVVVDGEIVIPDGGGNGLDFDALLQRIHPAVSRINRLAAETPTVFIAFDLLALGDESWLDRPFSERRAKLIDVVQTGPSVFITPASTDAAVANDWFTTFEGAGLDGVVAKRLDDEYQPDKRALDQGQAPAHRRLRAGRLPHPQGRRGRRLDAPRPVRRRRRDAPRRCRRRVHRQAAQGAARRARPADRERHRRASVGGVGRVRHDDRTSRRRPRRVRRRPQRAGRGRRAAGTPARTCPGCRCASNGSSR